MGRESFSANLVAKCSEMMDSTHDQAPDASQQSASGIANIADLIEILKADYDRFPKDQTFEIYEPDVYFKDPTSEFRGLDRYRKTIGFIDRWFRDPVLQLQHIQATGDRHIRTDWILTWTTPLPWQPRITIAGWSELGLSDRGLISSHIDYWHCSTWNVVQQHFSPAQAGISP
jgi:hypothetical protein